MPSYPCIYIFNLGKFCKVGIRNSWPTFSVFPVKQIPFIIAWVGQKLLFFNAVFRLCSPVTYNIRFTKKKYFCNIYFINYISAQDVQNVTVHQIGAHKPACTGPFKQIVLYSDRTGIEIQNYYLPQTRKLILWTNQWGKKYLGEKNHAPMDEFAGWRGGSGWVSFKYNNPALKSGQLQYSLVLYWLIMRWDFDAS